MTRQEAKEARQLQKQVGESTVIGQERSAPIQVEEKIASNASDYYANRNFFSEHIALEESETDVLAPTVLSAVSSVADDV